MWGGNGLGPLIQDLAQGVPRPVKNPGFTRARAHTDTGRLCRPAPFDLPPLLIRFFVYRTGFSTSSAEVFSIFSVAICGSITSSRVN